jgi:hypothetical protein
MVHSSNPVQRDIPTSLPEGGALIVRARQQQRKADTDRRRRREIKPKAVGTTD